MAPPKAKKAALEKRGRKKKDAPKKIVRKTLDEFLKKTMRKVNSYTVLLELKGSTQDHFQHEEEPDVNWKERVIKMLRKQILNHQWSKAAELLVFLIDHPVEIGNLLFKAGFQILQNHPNTADSNLHHMVDYGRLIDVAGEVSHEEVLLEILVQYMQTGKFENGLSIFNSIQAQNTKFRTRLRNAELDVILEGVIGILLYARWKTMLAKNTESRQVETTAERAMTCFGKVLPHPGFWDIFVTKYVELLDYYDRKEEAVEVVKLYARNNPTVLTAQQMLYDRLKDVPSRQKALETILKLNPCDKRVLDTADLYSEKSKIVEYFFAALDYDDRKDDENVWKIFSGSLSRICIRDKAKFREILDVDWKERKAYWRVKHYVHTEEPLTSVDIYKAVSLVFLVGVDDPFITYILNKKIPEKFPHGRLRTLAQAISIKYQMPEKDSNGDSS